MPIRLSARSITGPGRLGNEDAVATFALTGTGTGPGTGSVEQVGPALHGRPFSGEHPADAGVAFVVMHGLGGQRSGDVGCRYVVDALTARLGAPVPPGTQAGSDWLAETFRATSAEVQRRAAADRGGQGAIAVLILMRGGALHVAHAGHVRAYLFRDGRLTQLTRDDTLESDARDGGLPAEGLSQYRNVVTNALGFERMVVRVQTHALQPGDVVLASTRGLHGAVAAERIEGALRLGLPLDETTAVLEALAIEAGAEDNVSMLLAQLTGVSSADS